MCEDFRSIINALRLLYHILVEKSSKSCDNLNLFPANFAVNCSSKGYIMDLRKSTGNAVQVQRLFVRFRQRRN
nr:MAG TPA: hypothetical protein [Bacteriophage sp.]